MKELLKDDLEEVFFDVHEFSDEILHTNDRADVDERLKVIFDRKTEIVMDTKSEFGEAAAELPSILLSGENAMNIDSRSVFLIGEKNYSVSFIDEENVDLVRVYLEEKGV